MRFSKNPSGVIEALVYRAVSYDGAVFISVLNIYKITYFEKKSFVISLIV